MHRVKSQAVIDAGFVSSSLIIAYSLITSAVDQRYFNMYMIMLLIRYHKTHMKFSHSHAKPEWICARLFQAILDAGPEIE